MSGYGAASEALRASPRTWLVTGAAGFIGSHLVQTLLGLGQRVIGADNFSHGTRDNLAGVAALAGPASWQRFTLRVGDITSAAYCRDLFLPGPVDFVLHQAALASVPRSLAEPAVFHAANVDGFFNMLEASRAAGAARFVYASSSAVYGDQAAPVCVEGREGALLSPYALGKWINEEYAQLYQRAYGFASVGLRYFNVFGPRQDPRGAYAAVIPRWIDTLLQGEACQINGDGSTTRDFCHVNNVVQANILAATGDDVRAHGRVFNVGTGVSTTLNGLYAQIRDEVARQSVAHAGLSGLPAEHAPFRPGDILHSLADIRAAREILGFEPATTLAQGLRDLVAWNVARVGRNP